MSNFKREEGDQKLTRAMEKFLKGMIAILSGYDLGFLREYTQKQGEQSLIESLQLLKDSPLGPKHIFVAFVAGSLAFSMAHRGDDVAAEPYLRECLNIIEERVGLAHPKLDRVVLPYAQLLIRQHKDRQASDLLERFVAARKKRFGDEHLQVANALVVCAIVRPESSPETDRMLRRALRIYQRALPIKGRDSRYFYAMCLTQLSEIALYFRRHPVEAEKYLRTAWEVVQPMGAVAAADRALLQNHLGRALYEQARYAEAETALRRAIQLTPDYLHANRNLGHVLRARKHLAEAEVIYRKVIALKPDLADAFNDLGTTLYDRGRFTESLAAFRRGHELGSKQFLNWARAAARLSELEDKLPAIVQGGASAANAAEAIALASLCRQYKNRPAAAARLYAEAFTADPKLAADLNAQHRYSAACSAALAAAGQGEDARLLPDKTTALFRHWALRWLRDDLTAYTEITRRNNPLTSQFIEQRLVQWSSDPAFAAVHDPSALDRLPDNERAAWQSLWRDVEELAKRVTTTGAAREVAK
jgi:tetratricopeptide (TPR) repeat protein